MIQRGDGAGFLLEASGVLSLERLDGDDAPEPGVARFPHLTHPACADRGEDLVRSEMVADGQGQVP